MFSEPWILPSAREKANANDPGLHGLLIGPTVRSIAGDKLGQLLDAAFEFTLKVVFSRERRLEDHGSALGVCLDQLHEIQRKN